MHQRIEFISVMLHKCPHLDTLILIFDSEKHFEIATIDKFKLVMKNIDRYRQLNADMVPIKSLYFV